METIPRLFEESLKKYGQNPLIREKKDGSYQSISYREVHAYVQHLASALLDLGIAKNDRVALISEGRSEWLISELALLYCGAIVVPLSNKLTEAEELRFRLQHSGCRYIIVSGQQAEKIRSLMSQVKNLEKLILFDNEPGKSDNEILYDDLLQQGKAFLPQWKAILQERWMNIKGDDMATISYTSGTTADPKGIMLTHLNYITNLEQANSLIDVPPWYTTLLILSWDHSFAHTVGLYVMIRNGASLAVVAQGKTQLETLRNIPLNLKEVRPVFMLSVPALARSFRKNIEKGVKSKGKFMFRLFQQALKVSYKYHGNGYDPKTLQQMLLAPLVKLY
ncbi:MAG: AMP-binding protein, partial [bacterium]